MKTARDGADGWVMSGAGVWVPRVERERADQIDPPFRVHGFQPTGAVSKSKNRKSQRGEMLKNCPHLL